MRAGLIPISRLRIIIHLQSIIMFAKFASIVIVALSAASSISAAALPSVESTDLGMSKHLSIYGHRRLIIFFIMSVVRGGSHSFDNYGGFSSMSGFDNFYGSSNYDNSHFSESSITVVKEQEVVCHSESIEIIQQRLLVLQEMAKRLVKLSNIQSNSNSHVNLLQYYL